MRHAIAVRNVHFEDLGVFSAVLGDAGYRVRLIDVGIDDLGGIDPSAPDLLILLGGPLSVYNTAAYPFLKRIDAILKARLPKERPTFGICLGSQQIAAALGAPVRSMGYKEIGFEPLSLTTEGSAGPLAALSGVPVTHWHGDTFDIPAGAERLAYTSACRNQAFTLGPNIMGIQFHAEIDPTENFERRLVGHAIELSTAGADVCALRNQAATITSANVQAYRSMFRAWLEGLQL
ncbi:MAG: glutamine amidotransferase [Rhizomicrobium sp.]